MKMKKRLLFVVEAMGGGVFTYIVQLCNELVGEFEMYVAYALRAETPINYKEYFDSRIHLIKVVNFTRSVSIKSDIKAFLELKKIADQIRPDIIHLHSSKAGGLGRLAYCNYNIPVFYTPHGYSFLMQNLGAKKRILYKIIEIFCSKCCGLVISCSKGEHLESLKLTSKATYVDNGINLSELQSLTEMCMIDTNLPFTIYTIGRICHQKNPALFNQIALNFPHIHFLWIGDGELKDQLTAPNISITGWLERHEALTLSMSGDVFLLTSLWEGLPMSLLESMYMKKICIVSDVIGNRDVIKDGKNGIVCSTIDDFVRSINAIQKEPEYHVSLANSAYQDVIVNYSTKVMAKRYMEIYLSNENKN